MILLPGEFAFAQSDDANKIIAINDKQALMIIISRDLFLMAIAAKG